MENAKLDPAHAAMIVVDMQNDFVAPGAPMETPAARAVVPRLAAALDLCRGAGMRIVYTAHVHRSDGSDYGQFGLLHPPIIERRALVAGSAGAGIYPALAPAPGEHVIEKHRYSAFFGTDLDTMLRAWGIDTVIISGTTTENCCLSTARDALFNNYRVLFLSDATATCDYPDRGFGAMSNADLHKATLMVVAASTARVLTVAELADALDAGRKSARAA
ncbi:MAG: isochorismatase family protein [Devosia sp.]